mmetsp:Transcript_3324/g.4877  ORF Transcript_3324/g.4877 Transcript_3324/m.4877 type:complete len:114 (-) Transcript_3324:1025-1366(-)
MRKACIFSGRNFLIDHYRIKNTNSVTFAVIVQGFFLSKRTGLIALHGAQERSLLFSKRVNSWQHDDSKGCLTSLIEFFEKTGIYYLIFDWNAEIQSGRKMLSNFKSCSTTFIF